LKLGGLDDFTKNLTPLAVDNISSLISVRFNKSDLKEPLRAFSLIMKETESFTAEHAEIAE